MKRSLVLVVEDEPAIAELLAVNLRHAGFDVAMASNLEAAKASVSERLPDLVVLDWMLPDGSGVQLAKQWRASPRTKLLPIVVLTARSEEGDKVAGLDAGADDYVVKPFSPNELVARLRAVLRRRAPEHAQDVLRVGELALDGGGFKVVFADQELKLAPTEFKLLACLMAAPGRVLSRQTLLDKVWGDHVVIEERTVDVHVKRLREALGPAAEMLQTVRGAGYTLAELR